MSETSQRHPQKEYKLRQYCNILKSKLQIGKVFVDISISGALIAYDVLLQVAPHSLIRNQISPTCTTSQTLQMPSSIRRPIYRIFHTSFLDWSGTFPTGIGCWIDGMIGLESIGIRKISQGIQEDIQGNGIMIILFLMVNVIVRVAYQPERRC